MPYQPPLSSSQKGMHKSRSCGREVKLVAFLPHDVTYRIDERRTDSDALIIWKDYKAVNPFPAFHHGKLDDSGTASELSIHQAHIIGTRLMQICIQIMMLPEYLPDASLMLIANPVYLKLELRAIELSRCTKKRFSSVL